MSTHDYRLYSFVNMYLTGIHAGIQTAHVVGDMVGIYHRGNISSDKAQQRMSDWVGYDKTIIVLNGGSSSRLHAIKDQVMHAAGIWELPYAVFHESVDALEGVMTAVGIILPSYLYDEKSSRAQECPLSHTVWESKLAS